MFRVWIGTSDVIGTYGLYTKRTFVRVDTTEAILLVSKGLGVLSSETFEREVERSLGSRRKRK